MAHSRVSSFLVVFQVATGSSSEWELEKNVFKLEDFTERDPEVWGPVLKQVFDKGGEEIKNLSELFAEAEKEYKEKKAKQEEEEEEDGETSKKRTIDQVE